MAREPLARWSDTDHSGPIIIITVLCLVYWFVPGAGQQAMSLYHYRRVSWASRLHVACMLLGIVQSAVLLTATSHGLGKSITVVDGEQARLGLRLYHASNIVYIIVLGLSKSSAACSIISLTVPGRGPIRGASVRHKAAFSVTTVLVVIWTVAAIVVLGLQCPSNDASALQGSRCDGTVDTWTGIFVGDCVTDLLISAFAGTIIWPTKALLRLRLVWYIPFFIRLCVIILSGVRLATFNTSQQNDDPTRAIWLFAVLTQVQIFLSLSAAGFPAMKRTVLDLATNFGVPDQSREGTRRDNSYALSSLSRKSKAREAKRDVSSTWLYGAHYDNETVIRTGTSIAASDDGSQKGIVRRDDVVVTISRNDWNEFDPTISSPPSTESMSLGNNDSK